MGAYSAPSAPAGPVAGDEGLAVPSPRTPSSLLVLWASGFGPSLPSGLALEPE